jgi:hypothetical protein
MSTRAAASRRQAPPTGNPVDVFLGRMQNIVQRTTGRRGVQTRSTIQRAVDTAVREFVNAVLSGRYPAAEVAQRLEEAQRPLQDLNDKVAEAITAIESTTTVIDTASDMNTNLLLAMLQTWDNPNIYVYFGQHIYNTLYTLQVPEDVMAEIRAWYNRLVNQIRNTCQLKNALPTQDADIWEGMYQQSLYRLEAFCEALRQVQRYRAFKGYPLLLSDAEGDLLIELVNDAAEPGDQDQYGNWKRDWRDRIVREDERLDVCNADSE